MAFFALGIYQNYTERTLTPGWVPYILLYAALAGLLMPLIIWFSMTRPLIKRNHRGRYKP
jgi:hypothetical protein